jgi:hypothetical protein
MERGMISSLKDTNGKISSKRLITFVAFLLFGFSYIWDIFFEIKIQDSLIDGMYWIVLFGIGAVTGEPYFQNKGKNEDV